MKTCPNCDKEFENLGVHLRFCGKQGAVVDNTNIIIDKYMGKSLSSTIGEIEDVLKTLTYDIDINVKKGNGNFKSVELIIRIPIRR
jgi:hypothetical protein